MTGNVQSATQAFGGGLAKSGPYVSGLRILHQVVNMIIAFDGFAHNPCPSFSLFGHKALRAWNNQRATVKHHAVQ
jgi:hypothetical protein